jgi:hypothetical protein
LLYPVAAAAKEGSGTVGGDCGDGLGQSWFHLLEDSGFDSAQQLLELRPSLLDGIEVG